MPLFEINAWYEGTGGDLIHLDTIEVRAKDKEEATRIAEEKLSLGFEVRSYEEIAGGRFHPCAVCRRGVNEQ